MRCGPAADGMMKAVGVGLTPSVQARHGELGVGDEVRLRRVPGVRRALKSRPRACVQRWAFLTARGELGCLIRGFPFLSAH